MERVPLAPLDGTDPHSGRTMTECSTRTKRTIVAVLLSVAGAVALTAQTGFGQYYRRLPEGAGAYPPKYPPKNFGDGSFIICKLQYTSVRREAMGMGWSTDY